MTDSPKQTDAPNHDGPSELDELGTLAARLIVYGNRFARHASQLAGEGRSYVALRVLATLEHDGPQRVGELTARERLSQPAMTATVNRLEEEGLVERSPDPGDARASLIHSTDAGTAALRSFRRRAAAAVRPAFDDLSADDRAALIRAADLLAELSGTPAR